LRRRPRSRFEVALSVVDPRVGGARGTLKNLSLILGIWSERGQHEEKSLNDRGKKKRQTVGEQPNHPERRWGKKQPTGGQKVAYS